MNENRISVAITDEQKNNIIEAVQTLNTLLAPFLIGLEKTDKKRLTKVSDGNIPFVEKVTQYAVSNPEFVTAFTSTEEFLKDFFTFKALREFSRLLTQINSNVEDTRILAGSEAGKFARNYYSTVGKAAKMGVPGAQAIYEDLKMRFESHRTKRTNDEPE